MTDSAPSSKRGRLSADSGTDPSSSRAVWPLDVQQVVVDSLVDYRNLARRGQVQPAVFDSPTPAVIRFAADKLAMYGFEAYASNESRLRKEIAGLVSYYRCYSAAVELAKASGNAILSKQETSQLKEQFTIKSVRRVAEKGMELSRLGLAIGDEGGQGVQPGRQNVKTSSTSGSRDAHGPQSGSETQYTPAEATRGPQRSSIGTFDDGQGVGEIHLDLSNTLGFDVSSSFEAANPLPRLQSKASPAEISPRPVRPSPRRDAEAPGLAGRASRDLAGGYEPVSHKLVHSTPVSKARDLTRETQGLRLPPDSRKRDLPEYFEIDQSSSGDEQIGDGESTLHSGVYGKAVQTDAKDAKDTRDARDTKVDPERILEMDPQIAETSISFTLARAVAEIDLAPINKARLLEYLAAHREMRMFLVQLLQSDYTFFEYMLDYLLKYTIT